MLQTLKNAWKIPELRKKLLFTLFILLIYRLGSVIPVPFIDVTTLANYFDSVLSSTILGLYNAMSGSAFSRATVLALGIQPYINASIIIQLLTVAIPALERLAKEGGEDGKKKIERITRYTTVGLGLLMGWAYYMMLRNYSSQISIITSEGLLPALETPGILMAEAPISRAFLIMPSSRPGTRTMVAMPQASAVRIRCITSVRVSCSCSRSKITKSTPASFMASSPLSSGDIM